MALGILVLITALSISAVAIYYSIAGLVAIFAAAAIPIMIMGGVLEIGKLVTAVWLHRYWSQAKWWLKYYLATAVLVLMFITSMGIFGFLSKAHIEQTSAGEESIAQVQQIESEVSRLNAIIVRADEKIKKLESSGTGADANIQSQIDKEQERIDKAFDRIKPAIEQQNKIITDARGTDANRTKPYEDQLASITAEILRLETSAKEYETKIENLDADNSSVTPLLENIKAIEEEIIRVTNQLQSTEQGEIRAGQAIIGVTSDGLFGGNTRKALANWVKAQRDRITQIQSEVSQLRVDATTTVDAERVRLADVVKDIRTVQIPALKERELVMLGKIDDVRKTESPVIQTARDEIQRLRKSAEDQVANSQALIERLRSQLAQTDKADEIDAAVDDQLLKIKVAEAELDILIEKKYKLEGEYRMLEAEVGPIKYIAEFVYGETADNTMLEEAVRWVIMIIIFVFDPLAVLLLIASQYTFEFARKNKKSKEWNDYETARGNMIARNEGPKPDAPKEEDKFEDVDQETLDKEAEEDKKLEDVMQVAEKIMEEDKEILEQLDDKFNKDTTKEWQELYEETEPKKKEQESSEELKEEPTDIEQWNKWVEAAEAEVAKEQGSIMFGEDNLKKNEIKERATLVAKYEKDVEWNKAKRQWKDDNPDQSIKDWKQAYVSGRIHELPWAPLVNEQEGYVQNAEQSESSVWNKLQDSDNK
ncbi:hypothetical protein OAG45_00510 [bacterium]|jgi:hypothetical protein|nr:hypothetical protein [bacterium]